MAKRIVILTLVALILLTPVLASAQAVTWGDARLTNAVRAELFGLGVTEERPISVQDMRLLEWLYAQQWNDIWKPFYTVNPTPAKDVIRNLTGLQNAINLQYLNLSENFISDVAPISNLAKLKFVDMRFNDNAAYGSGGYLGITDPTWVYRRGFSLNPSNPQMVLLNQLQNAGAVVYHDSPIKRISGPDRYQTAVRIMQNWITDEPFAAYDRDVFNTAWKDGAEGSYNPIEGVVLARGDDYADALAGVPLAYELGFPILLTQSNSLNTHVKASILAYAKEFYPFLVDKSFTIVTLGGEAAVSSAVVNEIIYALETEFAALDIRQRRIAGADRFATSVAIAKQLRTEQGENAKDTVVIANGRNFPDALAVAPYAAMNGYPILLTETNSVPAAVNTYLTTTTAAGGVANAVNSADVIGGPLAVTENVLSALIGMKYRSGGVDVFTFPTAGSVTRVWGADRYATAVEAGRYYGFINTSAAGAPTTLIGDRHFFVATGENWADALAGAWLAAKDGTGLLLVQTNAVPATVATAINDYEGSLYLLGGEAAITRHNAVLMFNWVRKPVIGASPQR